jgi:hypothetical protein
MATPITTLAYTDSGSTIVDSANQNFSRRHAWDVVTLTDTYDVLAADEGTLFRLDSSTNAITLTMPDSADIYVGWTVRAVLVESSNGADVYPDTGDLYGLDGGAAGHKVMTNAWTQIEVAWTGGEWLVTYFYVPAP